jgi:hypothetical protein
MPSQRENALSKDAVAKDAASLNEFLDRMNLDDPVSVEDFRKAAKGMIAARGLFVYVMWKVLKEKGLDADALVQEACFQWGILNGENMGEIKTPADFMKKLSSKAGTLAWEQKYISLGDREASKEFYACPHVDAFRKAGCTPEETAFLCKELMCFGDYGTAHPHSLDLKWAEPTLGEGGKRCLMVVTPKEGAQTEVPKGKG